MEALFLRHEALDQVALVNEDWHFLDHVYRFLLPFKDVTKMAEGNSCTLDVFQPYMEFLFTHIERQEKLHAKRPVISKAIKIAQKLFLKYYNLVNKSNAYTMAVLLHPERRLRWL